MRREQVNVGGVTVVYLTEELAGRCFCCMGLGKTRSTGTGCCGIGPTLFGAGL